MWPAGGEAGRMTQQERSSCWPATTLAGPGSDMDIFTQPHGGGTWLHAHCIRRSGTSRFMAHHCYWRLLSCFTRSQINDLLNLNVRRWLGVHYAQIALFPLSALAIAWLIRGRTGIAAAISRVALFVFGVGWTAWDSVAGVATGILVNAAHKSGTPGTWRAPIDAIWLHPIMGGAPAPFFAVLGAVALSVGAVAAAIVLKRNGQSWGPVALLGVSSFGITIFKTHAWPGGPLTFGGIAIASAWLVWERKSTSGMVPARQTQAAATPH